MRISGGRPDSRAGWREGGLAGWREGARASTRAKQYGEDHIRPPGGRVMNTKRIARQAKQEREAAPAGWRAGGLAVWRSELIYCYSWTKLPVAHRVDTSDTCERCPDGNAQCDRELGACEACTFFFF